MAKVMGAIALIDDDRVLNIVHSEIDECNFGNHAWKWSWPWFYPNTIHGAKEYGVSYGDSYNVCFVWILSKATDTNSMAMTTLDIGYVNAFTSRAQGDTIVSGVDYWIHDVDASWHGNMNSICIWTVCQSYHCDMIKRDILTFENGEMEEFTVDWCYVFYLCVVDCIKSQSLHWIKCFI